MLAAFFPTSSEAHVAISELLKSKVSSLGLNNKVPWDGAKIRRPEIRHAGYYLTCSFSRAGSPRWKTHVLGKTHKKLIQMFHESERQRERG